MPDKRYFRKLESVAEPIISAYRNGSTLEELAQLHECSAGTVRNLLKAHGEPRRRKGPKLIEEKEMLNDNKQNDQSHA